MHHFLDNARRHAMHTLCSAALHIPPVLAAFLEASNRSIYRFLHAHPSNLGCTSESLLKALFSDCRLLMPAAMTIFATASCSNNASALGTSGVCNLYPDKASTHTLLTPVGHTFTKSLHFASVCVKACHGISKDMSDVLKPPY